MTNEDQPMDLAEMAKLMREQRAAARKPEARNIALMTLAWGIAWLIGLVALWSGEQGGNPWFTIPSPIEWIAFIVMNVLAAIVSIVLGIRMGQGTRGRSADVGAMYGWAWPISMIGAWLIFMGVLNSGIPPETTSVLAPSIFTFTAGVMYLVGGALWHSRTTYLLGAGIIAVTAAASLIGAPHHLLMFGLGGGGMLICFAAFIWFDLTRDRDEGSRS